MYTKKVMNIFQNPKHVGVIRGADGVGQVGNAVCGDIMKITIKVEDNKIVDAKFKTFGCVAAIASSSVACGLIIGKTLEEAKALTNKQVLEVLGEVPANKIHCSVLAEEAINLAIEDYHKKQEKLARKLEKQNKK